MGNWDPGLRRQLKARHLTMIAIGGSVGTGLFVASGSAIAQAGPAGALLSYALVGILAYLVMISLSEMAAHTPLSGSFSTYASKYIDEGFGFAIGWNYWYNWAVTIAAELVASQFLMIYWFPNTPGWIWSAAFLVIIFLLNYISVKGFGESEYWFSLIKITTIIIFISTGLLIIFDILKGGERGGWKNWTLAKETFPGNFSEIIKVLMIVSFSFQGIELIGIASGESENPKKNIPRAVRQVLWRILIFYILSIFIITLIIPYTDLRLPNNDTAAIGVSPFTLVFQYAGLLSGATVMNLVILASVLSAGNSGMYASARILLALATEGKAPRIFSKLSHRGVPCNALYATTLASGLFFLISMFDNQSVYAWLLNTSGMTGLIAWLGITISHYRFRRGYMLQNLDLNKLPYCSSLFPLGPICAFILCLIVTLGQNYQALLADKIDWYSISATYIGIPLFLIIWLGYRLIRRTHIVKYYEMTFPNK